MRRMKRKSLKPLLIAALAVFIVTACDKKSDDNDLLPGEPIQVIQPTELISSAGPGEEMPIELAFTLPNAVDSFTATYLLNDASIIDITGQRYDGSSVQETYSGTLTVPDSLPQNAFIRGNFMVTDVLDSMYHKSIKVNITQ